MAWVQHGGPDRGPHIEWDFSSNANVLPLPASLQARLLHADRRAYPEPSYAALRERLASSSGVHAERIVPTAGSSEGIRRLTLAAYLQGCRQVCVPVPGYGDYRAAALALGMAVWPIPSVKETLPPGPVLWWLCEPCNPTGASLPHEAWVTMRQRLDARHDVIVALDRAYEPLRLHGQDPVPFDVAQRCWQLHSPNKALGLTGVRAGWMQAPAPQWAPDGLLDSVWRLAPSWVLSAEGVNLLSQWFDPAVQGWLSQAREALLGMQQTQWQALSARGWLHQPSCTPFMVSRHPLLDEAAMAELHVFLRGRGIKWRDVGPLGLPAWVRWRVHQAPAHEALLAALDAWMPLYQRMPGQVA